MLIKFKKTHGDAKRPTYGTDGAACFDLYSCDEGLILQQTAMSFNIGLAFEIPDGHVMMIYSRSGHGFKNGVRLSNVVGICDADYRGTVQVRLHNDGAAHFQVNKGDRIAQAMVIPVESVRFQMEEELSDTQRGTGGMGSTGA